MTTSSKAATAKPRRRGAGWRTVRILVEIPLRGNVTDKAVIENFKRTFDHSLPTLDVPEVGRVRVKDANRVERGQLQQFRRHSLNLIP